MKPHALTAGMTELRWPSFKDPVDRELTPQEEELRDRAYLIRRRRCALADMYWAAKVIGDVNAKGDRKTVALQSMQKAIVALRGLGADKWLRRWKA